MLRFLLSLVLAAVLVVVIGVVAIVALDDDDDDDPVDTNVPVATPAGTVAGATGGSGAPGDAGPADQVLASAVDAVAGVTSFHFKLSHEHGSTPLPLSLQLDSAEGDVIVPGKMQADVDAKAAGINVSVKVIGIDDETWITNPFTRNWQRLPDTNIRDFADPAALVEGILPSIHPEGVSDGGTVDGVGTQLVTGTVDSAALSDALGIAEPGRTANVEAWIGTDDHLPRRVRLIGPLSDEDDDDVVREVLISRYGQAVEIMPPE